MERPSPLNPLALDTSRRSFRRWSGRPLHAVLLVFCLTGIALLLGSPFGLDLHRRSIEEKIESSALSEGYADLAARAMTAAQASADRTSTTATAPATEALLAFSPDSTANDELAVPETSPPVPASLDPPVAPLPGHSIGRTGQILDGAGNPLARATVRWGVTEPGGAISEWTTCSQLDGSYHLEAVPERAGRLSVDHPDHLPWSRHPIEFDAIPDPITLSWGAVLTVRVLDRGSACEDAQVVLGEGRSRRSAVSDADGRVRFTGLHPGRYRVHVAALDLRRSEYAGRRAPRIASPTSDDSVPEGRVIDLGSEEPVAIDLIVPDELRDLRSYGEARRDAEGGPPGTGARRALPPTSVERTRP